MTIHDKDIAASDEDLRLAALRDTGLLDTPPDPEFDRLTRLAARLLDCEIALFSLVDRDRQWFKSRVGLDVCEMPRSVAFCSIAIQSDRPLIVTDASRDERFADNPLVTGPPHIRFYAGIPLHADTQRIGTLCVIDSKPRRLSESDLRTLMDLTATMEELIRAHRRTHALERKTECLLEARAAIAEKSALFEEVERIGNLGWWTVEFDSERLTWSDEVYRIHDMEPGGPVDVSGAIDNYVDEDQDLVRRGVRMAFEKRASFCFEARLKGAGGTVKHVRSSGRVLRREGRPPLLVGVLQDISGEHRAHRDLRRAATRDTLTGLFNRRVFDETLRRRIEICAERSDCAFHVLLFDLDGFKDVNDLFGHLVGDEVLETVAQRIREILPEGCVAARWGGDEFAIITSLGYSAAQAHALGSQIVAAVADPITFTDGTVFIGATCGKAQYVPGLESAELLRRADLSLYHGKTHAPGSIHGYQPIFAHRSQQRQTAMRRLRDALTEGRVFAAYQPIVDLATNTVTGCEALLRFTDANGNIVVAGDVIPALIDPAISRRVHRIMLDHFCKDAARLFAEHETLEYISLNASEADLESSCFTSRLIERLEASKIDPAKLVIEVTETILLVDDSGEIRSSLQQLRDAGVRIALDDFGTGYSSLSHLRDFPISKIKIDRSFVKELTGRRESRLIVQAMVTMARQMGIDVIAEGVENEALLPMLQQIGCRNAQGFLFGHAQALDTLDWSHLAGNGEPEVVAIG